MDREQSTPGELKYKEKGKDPQGIKKNYQWHQEIFNEQHWSSDSNVHSWMKSVKGTTPTSPPLTTKL
jgi:hypothetical protein